MKRLHPVFNVVKLTPAPADPIVGRRARPPPPPELIDGEEEYIVERILDSRMHRRRLQYLIKWEGYGTEGNTWENADQVDNAPEKLAEFHRNNPAAPRRIRAMAFGSIPFRPLSLANQASSRCFSRGGVIVRGTPTSPAARPPSSAARSPSSAAYPRSSAAHPLWSTARSLSPAAHPPSPAVRPLPPLTRSTSLTPNSSAAQSLARLYIPPHRRTPHRLSR